ncbi:MAG TPA: hypothetical protein VKA08_14180, partial [Balneolales bacterium]|nr:hypothetical protein [Balneolales bacterium]
MRVHVIGLGIAIGMLCLFQSYTLGQTITNVPHDTINTRFYTDHFLVKRPGLSINGFDNGGNDSHGFGLKQILNILYNGSGGSYDDSLEINTYDKIVLDSRPDIINPNGNYGRINTNSQYLQSRAFVALARYILFKNGITRQVTDTVTAFDYTTAITRLHDALLEPASWYLATTTGEDEVKMTRSVENYARAVDLYLALENAYKYYNHITTDDFDAPELLDKSQKKQVLYNLVVAMHSLDHYLYNNLFYGVGEYEAEAGNRPMKMFVAVGYGALCMPDTIYNVLIGSGHGVTDSTTIGPSNFDKFLSDVFRSAGAPSYDNNSIYYWGYQTDNGRRFWAEGPYYFEYALMDVIPFWHAIRLNNYLNYEGYGIPDPFDQNNATNGSSRWMINPINWLADLATPDGELPPLDDSNKRSIRYAKMLRWAPIYGNAETGEKYAWIDNKVKNYNLDGDPTADLVELAIPRIKYTSGIAPPTTVSGTYQVNGSSYNEQQVVLREKEGNKTHYLMLNGEHGDAITRGEGHEQPDQLQFLYYVDGKSYLMDCGYNKTTSKLNSKWNEYKWHNVMALDYYKYNKDVLGYVTYDNQGGLDSPNVSTNRKESSHNEVGNLNLTKLHNGNIVHLTGFVYLATEGAYQTANIARNILYINDTKPYVIDLNYIHSDDGLKGYMMQYYGHGSTLWFEGPGWTSWGGGSTSDDRLFIYCGAVEFDVNSSPYFSHDTLSVLERDGINGGKYPELINKIKLTSYGDNHDFNTVAFLRVDNQPPDYAPHVVNDYNYNTENPFQVWYYQRDANTIDVLAMGSDVDGYGFPLNVNFDFDVIKDGTRLTNLTLAAN